MHARKTSESNLRPIVRVGTVASAPHGCTFDAKAHRRGRWSSSLLSCSASAEPKPITIAITAPTQPHSRPSSQLSSAASATQLQPSQRQI